MQALQREQVELHGLVAHRDAFGRCSVNKWIKNGENTLCCMFGNSINFEFLKKHAKRIFGSICFNLRSCFFDHDASFVPNQCTLPDLFSMFHYLSSSLAYLLSTLPAAPLSWHPYPPTPPPATFSSVSDSQHGIQSLSSCVIVCHTSICHLSSFFIHFCSQLVCPESCFFACLDSVCSLSIR